MKLSKVKRSSIVSLVMIAIAIGSVAYAVLTTQYNISNTLTIKGVGVSIYTWISDTVAPTTLKTSVSWNSMAALEVNSTEFLCLKNYGTQNLTLAFTNDMNSTFGTVKYEIEWYDISVPGWSWVDWGAKIVAGTPLKDTLYVPGDSHNPVLPGQLLGQRPTTPVDKSLGHMRITITIAASPPMGLSTSFQATCTGTEKL